MKSDFSPKSHFSMSAFLKICCIYSEHVFLRTPQTAASLHVEQFLNNPLQYIPVVFTCVLSCSLEISCALLVFTRIHLCSIVLYLRSLLYLFVFYSCSIVFTRVPPYSICVQSCSPVLTCLLTRVLLYTDDFKGRTKKLSL